MIERNREKRRSSRRIMGNDAEDLAQTAALAGYDIRTCTSSLPRGSASSADSLTRRDGFSLSMPDRVMFGTDGPWPAERLQKYWRFLETLDENFDYSEKEYPPQGFWRIHGVGLPDDVLRKIYSENALRLIPGVRERIAAYRAEDE